MSLNVYFKVWRILTRLRVGKLLRTSMSIAHSLVFWIYKHKEPPVDKNKNTRTVKVVTNPHTSTFLSDLRKLFNTEKGLDNIELTLDRYADYYLIRDHPLGGIKSFRYYNPKRALLYHSEPSPYLKKWPKKWSNPDERKFFHVSTIAKQGMPIQKIALSPCIDENIRIEKLSQYLGELPAGKKDGGLFPYKYHVTSESVVEDNYVTEKLTDAILAECLCFYHGTETARNRIDSRAFIPVDITKSAEAINIIKEAIRNNEWEKRIDIIRKEKQKILDDNILTDIKQVIEDKEMQESAQIMDLT